MGKTRGLCLVVAFLCSGCLLLWQALTVRYNYGGNWTGLFCTGDSVKPVPAALHSENIYLFRQSAGYDGQFYHYVAHDPFFTRNFSASVDAPRLRYQRILIPVLAYALALGNDRAIDVAYILVVAALAGLGVYWLSRFAVLYGYRAIWGAAFVLVAAVLVSMDRLTVDIALASCCVGFALYAEEQAPYELYGVLVIAGLDRETGLLLPAAYCLYLASAKRWREAAIFLTAMAPTAGWYLFVSLHTPGDPTKIVSPALFQGLAMRIIHPFPYPFSGIIKTLAVSLDFLALAGILVALGWAMLRARGRVWTPLTIAIYLFALLALGLSNSEAWSNVYAFGRTLTPLALLSALDGMTVSSLVPGLALLALDPRIGLQMGLQLLNIVHGISASL